MKTTNNNILEDLDIPLDYKHFISLLTNRLCQNSCVEKIYLFGSCARGSVSKGSDIDLAVIVSDEQQVDRSLRLSVVDNIEVGLLHSCEMNIPYDVVFFNESDFDRSKNISISVAREIEKEGSLLYER